MFLPDMLGVAKGLRLDCSVNVELHGRASLITVSVGGSGDDAPAAAGA